MRRPAMSEVTAVTRRPSADRSIKYVFRTADSATFEAVLIWEAEHDAYSICMSSQAGCRYGCTHCATTFARTPFVRNLTAGEIVSAVSAALGTEASREPLVRVDFAGIGDVAANWSEVVDASCQLLDRSIADSVKVTSIAPRAWVRRLVMHDGWLPDAFMFSLHGANVEQRRVVIPHADDPRDVLPLWADLASARPVVLNYVLCAHNTGTEDARTLGQLLAPYTGRFLGLRLSQLNPVDRSPLRPSTNSRAFAEAVGRSLPGWVVARHASVGQDVDAACGQMRASLLSG